MSVQESAAAPTKKKRGGQLGQKRPLVYNPVSEIIRNRHLSIVTGLSEQTIWRYRRAGRFPEHIQLGPHAIGWRRATIEQWIAERAGGR